MADIRRRAEYEIDFKTQGAEKKLGGFANFFKRTINTMLDEESKVRQVFSGTFQALGIGATQVIFRSPLESRVLAAPQAAQTSISALSTIIGAIFGRAGGAIIGNIIGQSLGQFFDAVSEEIRQVQGQALQQVQAIAAEFATAGVEISDEAVRELLQTFEEINRRRFEAMKRVVKVQDEQHSAFETLFNASWARAKEVFSDLGF